MSGGDGHPPSDVRDQLSRVGVDVVRAGLVVGSGGNLSARCADDETCWITAAGTWLDRLGRDSFVRVRIADGTPLSAAPVASSEVALHLATYRARADVRAIVHLHPQAVLLLDALGQRIRLVTTDHAYYLRRIARVPFLAPGSTGLAERAAAATVDGTNCVVLAHHGCSVLGETVDMAHRRAANLEEAARLSYRALVVGALDDLPECPPQFLDRVGTDPSAAI